jgi:hypothetical protein
MLSVSKFGWTRMLATSMLLWIPFSPVNVLLVLVKVDYVSGNVLMNDSHSDPTYWVTRWSYLLLLSILVWNVHLSTQYDSKELKWNLTWAMIVYFSSEIHTLNSSMIAIFLGYMCTRTSTTFRVFMSLSIRKKGYQKKKGKRLYVWTPTLCKVKKCSPS